MKVKESIKKERSIVEVVIELDGTEFERAINGAYQKAKHSISLPGFRPGKVPRKVVEARYGQNVFYEDAVNDICPSAVEFAVEQESLRMVGQPGIEVREVGKDGLVIAAQVPVYPEVHLRKYKGVPAVKTRVEVTPKDVENDLETLQNQAAWLESVDRALQTGDTAVIDYEGFDNGVPFEGGKAEEFNLVIGSGNFVPGFEDQLVGMKAGEEKDISVTFPENYHEELAGKSVIFHVKLHEVKEKKLPELDDEFAKDVSEFETLEALKEDRKAKLIARREEIAKQAFENQALRQVVDYMDADVPDAMIEAQLDRMVEEFAMNISAQGMQLEQYLAFTGKTMEDLRNDTRGGALYRVQLDIAMQEIVRLENIEAKDEEVESEIKRLAQQYNMEEDRVRAAVPVASLKQDLAMRKAVEFVVENAVEKGSVQPKEGEEIVVTEADREPEHHHHDEDEKETPAEEKKPAEEEKPVKKPRKRTTKKTTAAEGEAESTEKEKKTKGSKKAKDAE